MHITHVGILESYITGSNIVTVILSRSSQEVESYERLIEVIQK